MIKLIKFCLGLFDYFIEKRILFEIKKIFLGKNHISIIDVGAHKGEYITNILKHFKVKKHIVLSQIQVFSKFCKIKLKIKIILS